ncbi:MAG TPA: hypothetical protein VE400_15200 [Mycobacterium sp.]|nr:hypothetical protein [Mycobacterium sp.]
MPQFYLRGFANDAERIITVRLPGEKRYASRIRNTAATNPPMRDQGWPGYAGSWHHQGATAGPCCDG